jgi:hypothetical protein
MVLSVTETEPYTSLLDNLREDSSYSAQAYFEAAKGADFWGRAIVFVPALVGAVAGIIVALGGGREWGSVGAVVGAVSATASFIGSSKRASSFKDSARQLTKLRHRAAMEIGLSSRKSSESELEEIVKALRSEYDSIVGSSEPVPDRAFMKAQKRIRSGVLEYEGVTSS